MNWNVRVGMNTPWGAADHISPLTEWAGFVTTPSHGGLFISFEKNATIPAYMRRDNGWYEEDCDWVLPLVAFPELIDAQAKVMSGYDESKHAEFVARVKSVVDETFRNWHFKAYEKFHSRTLAPGESGEKDRHTFHEKHANDWLGVSVRLHPNAKDDFVIVQARVGGNNSKYAPGTDREFIATLEEYQERGTFPFVVDLKRHPPMPTTLERC